MMLYEAVHLQHSEHYYDCYSSPMTTTSQKMKHQDRVNNNNNNNTNNGKSVQRTKSMSSVPRLLNPQQQLQQQGLDARRGSYVVGQKLRESKWFGHDEMRVFCAVVETGFIVQRKDGGGGSGSGNDATTAATEEAPVEYGVAVWNVGEEKSKNADNLKIYSLHPYKSNFRVAPFDLLEFWPTGTKLRIFNQCDKTKVPHTEDIIRNQLQYAESTKQKWHSTEHFTYWCRYGPIQISQRVRSMTDAKWGNFGLNAGISQIKKRIRRMTNGK